MAALQAKVMGLVATIVGDEFPWRVRYDASADELLVFAVGRSATLALTESYARNFREPERRHLATLITTTRVAWQRELRAIAHAG